MAALEKNKGSSEEIGILSSEWYSVRQDGEGQLDTLLTRKLQKRSDELDVPLPDHPMYEKDNPEWDKNEHWYRTEDGAWALTQRSREYVDDAIWKKEERGYHRWSRWVTLSIGLVGTLTGLVSVIAANWSKFIAAMSHLWSLLHL